jgi:hypothetical protein
LGELNNSPVSTADWPADRPAWLAAWTAEDAMVRAGEEKCVAVGILGALSPDRLTFGRLAPGFIDGDSALAARFLYVWPEPAGRRRSAARRPTTRASWRSCRRSPTSPATAGRPAAFRSMTPR